MGTITATFDKEKDLTTVTVSGMVTADDLRDWGVRYYQGQTTALVLWDVTQADLSAVEGDQLREIAGVLKRISEVRRGGKTAFVYDKPLEYGIGRMFQSYSEMENMPFEVQAFRSFDDAMEWLGVRDA